MATDTVACATCGRTKTMQTEDDLVGWEWHTTSINGEVVGTTWRCPDHPASRDPDHLSEDAFIEGE